jgi:hypothetical protein
MLCGFLIGLSKKESPAGGLTLAGDEKYRT